MNNRTLLFTGNEINKIGIFRALQLGDLLCSIPAIRALRAEYPNAEIVLFGLPWASYLVKRFPQYFDSFQWFPGFPGLPEQLVEPRETLEFLQSVNRQRFYLVLQMQGNGSIVNPLMELMGASHSAGFYIPGHYRPSEDSYLLYPENLHEIERHLLLMEHLGIQNHGTELEFPINHDDETELQRANLSFSPGSYVCIHPGSRGSWRQWPPQLFSFIANHCSSLGFRVIITGTSDEMPIIRQVQAGMVTQPVIAAGKTSLGAVAALIKNAALLVSNCTGVSHIAAATKTPSVVISMDGEPNRWAPLNKKLHFTIDWTTDQDFDKVVNAATRLLQTTQVIL